MSVLGLNAPAIAQSINYDRIIPPVNQRPREIEELLVQLAWKNHPPNRIYEQKVSISDEYIKIARWNWTKDIRATFNITDRSIGTTENGNLFFPRYNIGIGFNLGNILGVKHEKKIAVNEKEIAEYELNAQKLELRAEVLRRYRQYLLNLELLQIRARAAEDTDNNYVMTAQKFKNGEATYETYAHSIDAYHKAAEAKAEAQALLDEAKYSVEELIGVKLEDVKVAE